MEEDGDVMLLNDSEYLAILEQIKQRIATARVKAALAVNQELVELYWQIGNDINQRRTWGNKFVKNLARDLKLALPVARGYSERNLLYMAQFAAAYPSGSIAQQLAAQLPWGHTMALLDKVTEPEQREWYSVQALEHGWSRSILELQIDTKLYQRQVTAPKTTNFPDRLPPEQSDLAVQTVKDPYIFDFFDVDGELGERELENKLVGNVTKLLLELGAGFAFVGQQYHIEVEGEDFYIDLLFYHLKLRCYVVVELKATKFRPAFAGQLNFYVSAVDAMLKTTADQPTIGILLCKDRRGLIAEFALKDIDKPIGVSEYRLVRDLPSEYADLLPSAEDIASRIGLSDKSDSE
jgi:predicted nuclease of restriction endonuclease-like (RecB) superfamily